MNKVQLATYNSFVKSDDFLDDHAAELAVVSQIAPAAASFKQTINAIGTAVALAEQDNTGYTIDKNNKLAELRRLMLKVGRAATAYYRSINNVANLAISDFTKTEVEEMAEARIPIYAEKLHNESLPHAANLIGADAADLAALQAAIVAARDVMEDPKRAIEISRRYNESIDGLIKTGREQREILDIYMRTFIDENEGLYNEWKYSTSIDDLPSHSAPTFTTPITALGTGTVTSVDYAPLGGLTGATDIEFTLPQNIAQGIRAGFGTDALSILPGKELQLSGGSSNRHSAASLGFDINAAPFLNIINDTPQAVSITVDFYRAD